MLNKVPKFVAKAFWGVQHKTLMEAGRKPGKQRKAASRKKIWMWKSGWKLQQNGILYSFSWSKQ